MRFVRRTLTAVAVGMLSAVTLMAPATAATTTTYTDPANDAGVIDIVEWSVTRDGADVTITVVDRNPVDLANQSQYEDTSLIVRPASYAGPQLDYRVTWSGTSAPTFTRCPGATAGFDSATRTYW